MLDSYNVLIDGDVVKKNHWKLTSGKHGELYVDKDKIITNPILYPLIVSRLSMLIREKLNCNCFDIVTGPAVAGINFSAPISINLGKIAVYPEKKDLVIPSRDTGGITNYEMVFRESFKKVIKGRRVVIIEDIVTTALSISKTAEAIYKCGGAVAGVFCIWNRDPLITTLYVWSTLIKNEIKYQFSAIEAPIGAGEIPVYGLVEKKVDSWWPDDPCPLCEKGMPLYDPKTDKIIEK